MSGLKVLVATSFAIAQKRFSRQVRENLLGYFWALITPAIYAFFFLLVKQSLSGGHWDEANFREPALRAFIGLTLLQLWFEIIQNIAQIVRTNRGVLKALTVDILPFFMALLFEGVFSLFIRILIVVCALLCVGDFNFLNSNSIGLIFLALVTHLVTALFIGLLLAPWASLFNDVRKFLSSSLMPVALLSPIFYPAVDTAETFLFWVNHVNPIASVLAVICNAIFGHQPILVNVVWWWLLIPFVFIFFLLYLLKKQIPILLERMGN